MFWRRLERITFLRRRTPTMQSTEAAPVPHQAVHPTDHDQGAEPPPPRGARARRPAQPVSAARPPVEASPDRCPDASRPDARLCGGYMMGSGMGGGCMLGSGN